MKAATVVKQNASKFPLRLLSSVRRGAQEYAQREGVSLNQFINVAVAERMARLQYQAWVDNRAKITADSISRALEILENAGSAAPMAGDELPRGYKAIPSARLKLKKL